MLDDASEDQLVEVDAAEVLDARRCAHEGEPAARGLEEADVEGAASEVVDEQCAAYR